MATVICEAVGGDADKYRRGSVAAAKTADKMLAADVTGAVAAGESRADETAGAARLDSKDSGMGDTCMSERGRSETEKSRSERAVVAAAWRCEIRRRKVASARTGDTGVAG